MADESQEPAPVPLGAQVMRKMHAALKALHGECSKAVGALDDCEAKTLIGEHMGTMEQSFAGMAKAFGVMPSIISAKKQWLKVYPQWSSFLAGANYSKSIPTIPNIQTVLGDFNQQLQGLPNTDPKTILNRIQAELQSVLNSA